ncbi:MAG TPA: hypothetical protein VF659_24145 [Pyrinomonadaceae bacterium]
MSIILTSELEELKAQAEGRRPFRVNKTLEALEGIEMKDYWKLDKDTRLAFSFYLTAKRRAEQLQPDGTRG